MPIKVFAVITILIATFGDVMAQVGRRCHPNIIDVIDLHPELTGLSYSFGLVPEVRNFVAEAPQVTLFAPSDGAFHRLTDSEYVELMTHQDLLTYILQFHFTETVISSAMARSMDYVEMYNGRLTSLMTEEDWIFIDDSRLVEMDLKACNGTVHLIDKVIGS